MLAASRTIRSGRSSRNGEPGTRLAWGTRFGRPAEVSVANDGVAAFSAARQPVSFGLVQSRSAESSWPVNQADRAAAKISRSPSPSAGTGGRVLPPRGGGGGPRGHPPLRPARVAPAVQG